ncbi:MAG: vitamin K epoxide reductase family protein [Acidobacteriaceae bacterium]
MSSAFTAVPDRNPHTLLAAATCAAIATLIPVAAHQLGAIDHLPDPPGSFFASDRITESSAAHPLGVPDALPGLGSYAVTLALATTAPNSPRARRLLAFKLPLDGALAGFNLARQVVSFRKICSWCTATALCTALMVFAGRQVIAQEIGKAGSCR